MLPTPFLCVHLVPTGLGAAIGGFAGDATPATNALAAVADQVLTHPNVLNAASLFAPAANVSYVDGMLLDRFLMGDCALAPVRANRIGLIVDRGAMAHWPLILNALNAARAVGGIQVVGYSVTESPLDLAVVLGDRDRSTGRFANPETLLAAGAKLVAAGAEALAVAALMPELPAAAVASYEAGNGPDPIGGLEALISRVLTDRFNLPCANAPVEAEPWEMPTGLADARVAAETISPSYLPCLLFGLSRSPRPVTVGTTGAWQREAVGAVVVAHGAAGGPGALGALGAGIPVVAVAENKTVQSFAPQCDGLITVANYWEAAGVLACLKAGLDPHSVRRPLPETSRL